MSVGTVLAADHDGHYVIKMAGDVRVTLCVTIDDYFEAMFKNEQFAEVVLDLTEVEGVDSTTLGLMAKLAVKAKSILGYSPVLFSPGPSITRLLHSMGFEDIFVIREEAASKEDDLGALPAVVASEENVRNRVVEAHRTLMGLNDDNKVKFAELIKTLEAG